MSFLYDLTFLLSLVPTSVATATLAFGMIFPCLNTIKVPDTEDFISINVLNNDDTDDDDDDNDDDEVIPYSVDSDTESDISINQLKKEYREQAVRQKFLAEIRVRANQFKQRKLAQLQSMSLHNLVTTNSLPPISPITTTPIATPTLTPIATPTLTPNMSPILDDDRHSFSTHSSMPSLETASDISEGTPTPEPEIMFAMKHSSPISWEQYIKNISCPANIKLISDLDEIVNKPSLKPLVLPTKEINTNCLIDSDDTHVITSLNLSKPQPNLKIARMLVDDIIKDVCQKLNQERSADKIPSDSVDNVVPIDEVIDDVINDVVDKVIDNVSDNTRNVTEQSTDEINNDNETKDYWISLPFVEPSLQQKHNKELIGKKVTLYSTSFSSSDAPTEDGWQIESYLTSEDLLKKISTKQIVYGELTENYSILVKPTDIKFDLENNIAGYQFLSQINLTKKDKTKFNNHDVELIRTILKNKLNRLEDQSSNKELHITQCLQKIYLEITYKKPISCISAKINTSEILMEFRMQNIFSTGKTSILF